jgi:hypothetical protein
MGTTVQFNQLSRIQCARNICSKVKYIASVFHFLRNEVLGQQKPNACLARYVLQVYVHKRFPLRYKRFSLLKTKDIFPI